MKSEKTVMSSSTDALKSVSDEYFALLKRYASSAGETRDLDKCNGRFFTHEAMATNMITSLLGKLTFVKKRDAIRIVDPFAGDGRLVRMLLSAMVANKCLPRNSIFIRLTDIDISALATIKDQIGLILKPTGISFSIEVVATDVFLDNSKGNYDICITNPPWCILKPTQGIGNTKFDADQKKEFNTVLNKYQSLIRQHFSLAGKGQGFSRNCLNLSRCGLEKALNLVRRCGVCAIVMPATLFSDQVSGAMRRVLFEKWDLINLFYYPAECKLFGKVDQTSVTFVVVNRKPSGRSFEVRYYDKHLTPTAMRCAEKHIRFIKDNDFIVPFGYTEAQWDILVKLQRLHILEEYPGITFVRELDETRIEERLTDSGSIKFIKGYMVDRFSSEPKDARFLNEGESHVPASVKIPKIVWRDVSRESQLRRLKATLLPAGYIAGNSLGVLFLKPQSQIALSYILAVMNSYVFEFQAKLHLVTNHVPAGGLKKIHIPSDVNPDLLNQICEAASKLLRGDTTDECNIECLVAKAYGLTSNEFFHIVNRFEVSDELRERLSSTARTVFSETSGGSPKSRLIEHGDLTCPPNHYAAKLSELDKLIISYVPQGGNWKNIPESVPSQRLVQIRESFKAGKGSRSTYYGRLRENAPSYTISTYFARPGNGCNIHYDQPRTLSQREAARLQSFPDYFEFKGTKGAVDDQIGNAVPPLLAYQVAIALPDKKGMFVDLFCGAGGLALGFMWAGWIPIVSNDIMPAAIETHRHNIDETAICGDITSKEIVDQIVSACTAARAANPDLPLYVIGGPPCQGFSTANCNRSTDDQRNWLFKAYLKILQLIKPQGFIFENVTGILNFQQGNFFKMIVRDLKTQVEDVRVMILNAAEYGVPQRRERVIIYGSTKSNVSSFKLAPITRVLKPNEMPLFPAFEEEDLPPAVNVKEAFSDLPPISDAEDGSQKPYATPPTSNYQRLMRGEITPNQFMKNIRG